LVLKLSNKASFQHNLVIFHLRRHQVTYRKQNGGRYTGSTLDLRKGIRYKRNSNGNYHIFDHAGLHGDTYNIVRGSPTKEFKNGGQWTGTTPFDGYLEFPFEVSVGEGWLMYQ